MHVDQAGHHGPALAFDPLVACGDLHPRTVADSDDSIAPHQHRLIGQPLLAGHRQNGHPDDRQSVGLRRAALDVADVQAAANIAAAPPRNLNLNISRPRCLSLP